MHSHAAQPTADRSTGQITWFIWQLDAKTMANLRPTNVLTFNPKSTPSRWTSDKSERAFVSLRQSYLVRVQYSWMGSKQVNVSFSFSCGHPLKLCGHYRNITKRNILKWLKSITLITQGQTYALIYDTRSLFPQSQPHRTMLCFRWLSYTTQENIPHFSKRPIKKHYVCAKHSC